MKDTSAERSSSSSIETGDDVALHQKPPKGESSLKPKRFHNTSKDMITKACISRSMDFEVSPPIVHFAGFTVGVEFYVDVNIINISKQKVRMNILPLNSTVFKIYYKLVGSLAPGMSQKVRVKFTPSEYRYFYGCIRIHGEEEDLLVPIHAYPVLSMIDFPKYVQFGCCPLAEAAVRKIDLKSSVPIQFSFELDIIKPHPYFTIAPLRGVIPADGNMSIKITFHPITLGTCNTVLRLNVAQHGFEPVECMITAKAISGAVEASKLLRREQILKSCISCNGSSLNGAMGNVSESDPVHISVSNMLSSTFRSNGMLSSLHDVMQKPGGNFLNQKPEKKSAPKRVKGPGSGASFDPGYQWLSLQLLSKEAGDKNKHFSTLSHKSRVLPYPEKDRISGGFHVPFELDSTPGVNSVITQEIGKLKVRDLRTPIVKSTVDGETEEDDKRGGQKILDGGIDVNNLLKEERLNFLTNYSTRRQVREMGFKADVDSVICTETEKGFRITNEYNGSKLFSCMDLKIIECQRAQCMVFRKKEMWRTDQDRVKTEAFSPMHAHIKARSKSKIVDFLSTTVKASFDKNENDVWSKRLNSLRRLVGLVSRCITRTRVEERVSAIRKKFNENGCFTKKDIDAFIAFENENNEVSSSSSSSSSNSKNDRKISHKLTGEVEANNVFQKTANTAILLCSLHNNDLMRKFTSSEMNIGRIHKLNACMIRRVLFPKFLFNKRTLSENSPENLVCEFKSFNDQSFFPMKIRPEHVYYGYSTCHIPKSPVYFSISDLDDKIGAREEFVRRPKNDSHLNVSEILGVLDKESLELCKESSTLVEKKITQSSKSVLSDIKDDTEYLSPGWFEQEVQWPQQELQRNHRPNPEMRIFTPRVRLKETDALWQMRPKNPSMTQKLSYKDDCTLRSRWINDGVYLPFHFYAMGGDETSGNNANDTFSKVSFLSEFYLNDVDRHSSGFNCMSKDHLRGLTDADPDIGSPWPFMKKKDPNDDLTDSDSDEEGEIIAATKKPIDILNDFYKRDHIQNDDHEDSDEFVNVGGEVNTGSVCAAGKSGPKKNQVQLLRDRKIIEIEKLRKERKELTFEAYYHELQQLADCTKCPLDKIEIQRPFHMYCDNVYKVIDRINSLCTMNCDESMQCNITKSLVREGNDLKKSLFAPSYAVVDGYAQSLHRHGAWRCNEKQADPYIHNDGGKQKVKK